MRYFYSCGNCDCGYYIKLQYDSYSYYITADQDIARFLKMSIMEYQDILKIKFNGIIKPYNGGVSGIFFKYKKDCRDAVKYLCEITNSYFVMKELIGE